MANLVLNGKSIDNINDIAENFVEEDVLREFRSGSLASWLEEYGYEEELERVRSIKPTASSIRVLAGISEALNLDDDVIAAAAERRTEQQRKEEAARKAREQQQRNDEEERQRREREAPPNVCDKSASEIGKGLFELGETSPCIADELKDIPKWANFTWNSKVTDWDLAFREYSNAARNGDPCAMGRLAFCYSCGAGTEEDEDMCFYWASKGAEQGDAEAQTILGDCYKYGKGVTSDKAEAVRWYRLAAEQGYEGGVVNLMLCYEDGEGVLKDAEKAFTIVEEASRCGSAWAETEVGRRYFCGDGVAKDRETAVLWFRNAAKQGYPYAQLLLGICYCSGLGVCKDVEKGRALAKKSAEGGQDVTIIDMIVGTTNGESNARPCIGAHGDGVEVGAVFCQAKQCSICAEQCPVGAIPKRGSFARPIDADLCTRCGICAVVCPVKNIGVQFGAK